MRRVPGVKSAVVAIAVGVVNGLVFVGFEWLVGHGDDWLWNDAGNSDALRWRVIPLAIGFSVGLITVMLPAIGGFSCRTLT